MKPITLRLWVPEETPDPTVDHGRLTLEQLHSLISTADGGTGSVPSVYLLTEKEITNIADGIAEREYRQTVTGVVEDLKRAVRDGEITDRDGAMDWLHDTIDGHHDVIYISCAQDVVRLSRNDGAYFEQFGDDGAVEDGAINWSRLAYCALEADVLEAIGDLDSWFQCSECNGDVTEEDLKIAGDDLPVCEDCRRAADGDEEDEEGDSK
jgi:hypothetical protein